MFCPNCGKAFSSDLKFCRYCGLNLAAVTESLLEQIPESEILDLKNRERRLERFGGVIFSVFAIIALAGVLGLIYAVLNKMIFSGNNPALGIFLLLFIIFAALALAWVVMNETVKEKRSKIKAGIHPREISTSGSPAKKLPETFSEPIPSIIEDTTELLHVKRDTHRLD